MHSICNYESLYLLRSDICVTSVCYVGTSLLDHSRPLIPCLCFFVFADYSAPFVFLMSLTGVVALFSSCEDH